MRRRRKTDLAKAKEKAKAAWSFRVRDRAGWCCEYCGTPNQPQAHHVIPSTWERYRFDLRNGVCLCWQHHKNFAHGDGTAFTEWLYAYRPKDVRYFKQERKTLSQNRTAQDYLDIAAALEPESEGMEDAA